MQLSSGSTDFASGALGMVELAASYSNDRNMRDTSKAEWTEYLNQAQLHIANQINRYYETFFMTSSTATLTAGDSVFQLPSDIVHLIGAEVGDDEDDKTPHELVEVHVSDRDLIRGLDEVNRKRDLGFFFIVGDNLELSPSISEQKTLRVYYVKRLTPMSGDTDESEIPAEHHELVVLSAVRRAAFKKNRRNTPLDDMYAEHLDSLRHSIVRFSTQRVEQAEPWFGTQSGVPTVRREGS